MLKENLIMLRNIHGYSQEEIAEKIDISRQAYSKWEKGTTIPDISKSIKLAEIYGISIDSLVKEENADGIGTVPPAPKGKFIWGTVTVNERGQIVIPKSARDKYHISNGQRIVVLGDEEGIALLTAEKFEENIKEIMHYASVKCDKED